MKRIYLCAQKDMCRSVPPSLVRNFPTIKEKVNFILETMLSVELTLKKPWQSHNGLEYSNIDLQPIQSKSDIPSIHIKVNRSAVLSDHLKIKTYCANSYNDVPRSGARTHSLIESPRRLHNHTDYVFADSRAKQEDSYCFETPDTHASTRTSRSKASLASVPTRHTTCPEPLEVSTSWSDNTRDATPPTKGRALRSDRILKILNEHPEWTKEYKNAMRRNWKTASALKGAVLLTHTLSRLVNEDDLKPPSCIRSAPGSPTVSKRERTVTKSRHHRVNEIHITPEGEEDESSKMSRKALQHQIRVVLRWQKFCHARREARATAEMESSAAHQLLALEEERSVAKQQLDLFKKSMEVLKDAVYKTWQNEINHCDRKTVRAVTQLKKLIRAIGEIEEDRRTRGVLQDIPPSEFFERLMDHYKTFS